MNVRTTSRGVRLRRSSLALALGMSLASGAVYAQSNASGTIFGREAAGSTVHIVNKDTGFTRDITVGNDGRYRASALPVGRYEVTLLRDGSTVGSRDDVQVSIGQGSEVVFAPTGGNAQNLEGVQVVANALPSIDVSSVDTRTTLTAEQLTKLPVTRNVNAAAMLTPGAVAGDSRYGNVVSLGGSSAAENQYYINGYAVTNPLTGLGFTTLPFDAIDQEQVFAGGYGAEYGRSTGGVVNIVTKRGGNTWKGGAYAQWTPAALRQSYRSIYRTNGELVSDRSGIKPWETQYAAYIGGPLIKDKLFIYATGETTRSEQTTIGGVSAGASKNQYEDKGTRWMGKVDWNITDNHVVELTGMGESNTRDAVVYNYDYPNKTNLGRKGTIHNKNLGTADSTPGGSVYVGKYTGYLTDDLTISALYGRSHAEHVESSLNASGLPCPLVGDGRASIPASQLVSGCATASWQKPGTTYDDTHGYRLDIEYRLGSHDLRVGYDAQDLESFSGQEYSGGQYWIYNDTPANGAVRGGSVLVPAGHPYIVRDIVFRTAAKVKVKQEAEYIEDHWQVSDRWLAYLGLRNEQFSNFNGDGVAYTKQRHQLAPRLGLSWDVFGDSSLKVYANAGRYHLAIPSNVAIRAASGSLYSIQYGVFDSIDPSNDAPVNFQPIEAPVYSNGEDGSSPDPKSVSARGLQAYYQDEYILGFDKTMGSNWTFGAKLRYRKLKSIIDDVCDPRPFETWGARNGVAVDPDQVAGCFLFNPGKTNKFTIDVDGDGTYEDVKLTREDYGLPEAKRGYYALDMYLEHSSEKWYGRVDYTFSRSYGNTEGMLKSDIGQTDPSVTQDWDFKELMYGANGPEANDRTHQIRAYGYYQFTPEWLVGANLSVVSGRPKNCIGNYPGEVPDALTNYGAAMFYCDGKIQPRGSKGRLPWSERLDLNVQYRPNWANNNLTLAARVYNVFGQQRVQQIEETGEDEAVGQVSADYMRPLSFSTPRYFEFSARYDFSL